MVEPLMQLPLEASEVVSLPQEPAH